jgi:hypothetical protein
MIFIDAVEIDERLASHLIGSDPFLSDQLIGFSFSELSIATPVLKLGEPAPFVVVVLRHGYKGASMISAIVGIRTGPRELAFVTVTCMESPCEMTLLPG